MQTWNGYDAQKAKRWSPVTVARVIAGLSPDGARYPIQIVDGHRPPRVVGQDYYWTTPSGKTIVRHPNAYKWPTVYHGSTRRVAIGRDYCAAFLPELLA
jgi:hypothetical protein